MTLSSRFSRASLSHRGLPAFVALACGGGVLGYLGWTSDRSAKHVQRPLSYSYFTPLTIRAIKQITSDSSIVSLSVPKELLPNFSEYPDPPSTPLQAVYIRQPELQIQRAYTPLNLDGFKVDAAHTSEGSTADGNDTQSIELLIKRYKDGEVSSYVHRQGPGDQLWIRGPVRTWTLPEADELIFVSSPIKLTLDTKLDDFFRSPEEPVLRRSYSYSVSEKHFQSLSS